MSHKGTWICKCHLKHNISKKDIDNNKFRPCSKCGLLPSTKDIVKAKKQINEKKLSSIRRQVIKAL